MVDSTRLMGPSPAIDYPWREPAQLLVAADGHPTGFRCVRVGSVTMLIDAAMAESDAPLREVCVLTDGGKRFDANAIRTLAADPARPPRR